MLLKIKISAEALANEKFEPMFTIEEHSGGKVVINKFIINSEWSTKEDALVIAKKEGIRQGLSILFLRIRG